MHRSTSFAILFALAAACSTTDDASSPAAAPAPSSAPAADAAPSLPSEPTGPSSVVVASFDPQKYELPEALSVRDGAAYVSFIGRGEIERVAPDGSRSLFAKLPVSDKSYTLGSAFDAAGDLFVGVAPEGVIRVKPSGETTLFASSNEEAGFKFANALSFDPDGRLYVADAGEGAIYRFGAEGAVGTAKPWLASDALKGDVPACPGTTAAFPIGANGIFAEKDAVWVAHTDRGQLLRVAVNDDGTAGAITTVISDCATLEGIDGLRPDPRAPSEGFIAAINSKNAIVAISRAGVVTPIVSGPPYHGPADLGAIGGKEVLVVASSFAEAFAPADAGLVAKPALVKLTLP